MGKHIAKSSSLTAMVDKINFLLDVGQGRSQALISYNQVLNYLEKENQEDESLSVSLLITCLLVLKTCWLEKAR